MFDLSEPPEIADLTRSNAYISFQISAMFEPIKYQYLAGRK